MTGRAFNFDAAIARIPRWMLGLTFAGLPFAFQFKSVDGGGGFLAGALLAYVNYRIVERAVNRIAREATADMEPQHKPSSGSGIFVFFQFGALALLAFGILRVSGIDMTAAFVGFLMCPVAVPVEILYELLTYGHP